MDVVGWLRGLELEHAITGRTSSGEMLFDSEPERVAVPVLIVANTSDACPASPPGDAEDRRRALPTSAQRSRLSAQHSVRRSALRSDFAARLRGHRGRGGGADQRVDCRDDNEPVIERVTLAAAIARPS